MAKLILIPQSGTISDAKKVCYRIEDLDGLSNGERYSIKFENATHDCKILCIHDGVGNPSWLDLRIPPSSSESMISVFAHILRHKEDESLELVSICPAIFYIEEQIDKKFEGSVNIFPSFAGPNDLCSINIQSKPNTKTIFSINDRRLPIVSNADGVGSVHFKGQDILENKKTKTLSKYPLYFYSEEDNFVNKNFTGSYLHVMPENIAAYADIDPRCDPDGELYAASEEWTMPEECIVEPDGPSQGNVQPTIPAICIPTSCRNDGDEGNVTLESTLNAKCRINGHDATLLNNGMILHGYIMVDPDVVGADDDGFNINKIYISTNKSTIDTQVIVNRDVTIAPKTATEDFVIHVKEDLWNHLSYLADPSLNNIMAVFYNKGIGYICVWIKERLLDEYTGAYTLIGDVGSTAVTIDTWLFCVNTSFYHGHEEPTHYPQNISIGYISDSDGNNLQALNLSVASNTNYIGSEEESIIYVVAEASLNNESQLFFYSFSVGYDEHYTSQSYGWVQLTSRGNNKNPKIYTDKDNTLHVMWESDRSGSNQIYYGVLGNNSISLGDIVFSSSIDKQADFLRKGGDRPSEYLSTSILIPAVSSEYTVIPEYDTESLVDGSWVIQETAGGSVSEESGSYFLNDLTVTANVVDQSGIAFMPLQILQDTDNPSIQGSFPYNQYNYQVDFEIDVEITQPSNLLLGWDGTVQTEKDIDQLFTEWKSEFSVFVDTQVSDSPVYIKDSNKFILGRQDGIFDRIVPIVGSYDAGLTNPSVQNFQIKILKNDNTLKDFSFGLMLEKTYFKAANIQTSLDYLSEGNPSLYMAEEVHTIYTGRAKLVALIKTQDGTDDRANYYIFREFPEVFDITQANNITIMANYAKITSGEVVNLLDVYEGSYTDRFIGTVTLFLNSNTKFSESFVSYLSEDSNYFDIGFGVPSKGYYAADRMFPSKMTIFDNVDLSIHYSNITIASPTYTYNSAVLSLPDTSRALTELRRFPESALVPPSLLSTTAIDNSSDLFNLGFRGTERIYYQSSASGVNGEESQVTYDVQNIDLMTFVFDSEGIADQLVVETETGTILYNTGFIITASSSISFDVDVSQYDSVVVSLTTGGVHSIWSYIIYHKVVYDENNFIQVPITFEGRNQSHGISNGMCNDIHIAWCSNRDKYWNIYTTNTADKFRPFRFDTKITNTQSNSISPSISIDRNGRRMIAWHDDRDNNFDIFCARSLSGDVCNEDDCRIKMIEVYEEYITECSLSFSFTASSYNTYHFSIEFYNDNGLSDLFATLSTATAMDKWYVNGESFVTATTYNNAGDAIGVLLNASETVTVSYIPDKDNNIFDRVLYTKLVDISD